MEQSYGFPSNFASKQMCSMRKNKLSTKNGVGIFIANFCLCSRRKQNFYLKRSWYKIFCILLFVQQKKNISTKYGVVTKFIANFCLCSIKKIFLPMELSQNLLQTFACVASEKQNFSQKWSCHKIYCKCKIFLICVHMIFKYSKQFRFSQKWSKKSPNSPTQ